MPRLAGWISLVLFATSAWAQTEKVVQQPDRTVVRLKTSVDFTDLAIEAEVARPAGSYVPARRQTDFKCMIQVRGDFVPELQKSVDRL